MNRNDIYYNKPFKEYSQDLFTHISITDLIKICNENKEIIKFRSIGIIESVDGHFYIKDISSSNTNNARIVVSMAYMKSLPNTVLPFTAQIFGTIQWMGRPVIFANIIQVYNPATALRINDIVGTITKKHLANRPKNSNVD